MRGHKMWMDRFINDLMAQYLPYEYEPGKHGRVQLAVRPIELFELVFPEGSLREVCSMIQPYDKKAEPLARIIRRLMHLNPYPKGVEQRYGIINNYVAVTGIGIKKDKRYPNGCEML